MNDSSVQSSAAVAGDLLAVIGGVLAGMREAVESQPFRDFFTGIAAAQKAALTSVREHQGEIRALLEVLPRFAERTREMQNWTPACRP